MGDVSRFSLPQPGNMIRCQYMLAQNRFADKSLHRQISHHDSLHPINFPVEVQ